MMKKIAIDNPDNYLVNPYLAIRLFAKTYLALGDVVMKDRKYKVTREAWIASMFLIALSKNSGLDWWFTPVSDNSGSPDFNCYTMKMSAKYKGANKNRIKLEVFEWRKSNPSEEFISALTRIKLNKIIDPEITLLCYIKDGGTIPPAVLLNSRLKQINPKVKDVWYLGDVSRDGKTWRVTQIYPNLLAIDIDYDEILHTKEEHSFVHTYRASSEKVEFEHTDQQVLLTPEFEFQLFEK